MNYLQEWGNSCVDRQLTQLNVTSLSGSCPSNYLLYAEAIPRRNDGRVSDRILKRYQHTEQGGWWCSGIDILTKNDDLWGCFKPKVPRFSTSAGKPIKYEHPPLAPTGIFALRVPLHLWQQIAQRYSVTLLPEEIDRNQPDLGFWQWLEKHSEVPLCITEGAKKAGALLTAGYAAIALPGINSGYRVPKDEQGNRIGKSHLIPQLLKLVTKARSIYIAFDQDSKPHTIKAVKSAIQQLGYLLKQQGCTVNVITWNQQLGKGVDDLIAVGGQKLFDEAYQTAMPIDTWKAQSLTMLTYPATVQINSRYLPTLPIPTTAKLIGIKSPKGTGKTQLLESIVKEALARSQWVLVLGHRVRLVEALCQRFGLNYITEVRDTNLDAVLGYGLCIDSLHANSQARFHAGNWSDGIVIIDEVEQVLWHGLDSSTCTSNRVAILKSLKTLIQNVLGKDGQVFVADADLSDVALDYLISLSGVPLQPFIIQNDWQPEAAQSWQVHSYPENTPEQLVKDLEQHIRDGGKPFVCLSAQKRGSQWSTCNLEAYLQQKFPSAKILRIDSESLAEPMHPAYGCITNLDQVLGNYDIILTSPVIETGVSIEIQKHFTSVWGIAQGIQSENSVRQALGRIRENLPRFIWVATYGFNQVGNGSTSIPALLTSGQNLTQFNIRLLQQSDFDALDDLEMGYAAESLLCWAKMAVRLNAAMLQYRESVLAGLRNEGHQIREVPCREQEQKEKWEQGEQKPETNSLLSAIAAVRNQNYQTECEAIALSQDLTTSQYQALQKRLAKTLSQRRSLRKYELKLRYRIPVTPELVAKDDTGWYPKLLLHYFLTVGRQYLPQRDAAVARQLIDSGNGQIFLPDFNRSQLGSAIAIMETLGLPLLLHRDLKNTDEDLQAMLALAVANRAAIKTGLGIGISQNTNAIAIVRRLLDKIGYSLECIRRQGTSANRVRVYRAIQPEDGRSDIFKQWLAFEPEVDRHGDRWLNSLAPTNKSLKAADSSSANCYGYSNQLNLLYSSK